jgi:DNA-binding transcriptional MerR regulator
MSLISKKELLAATGISYGQLYRWKRERLIPEEWFIKQSSFTGQETFFPRERILDRIKAILELKDNHSLEELAEILLSEDDKTVSLDTIRAMSFIDEQTLKLLPEVLGKNDFALGELAFAYGICQNSEKAGMTGVETRSVIERGLPLLAGRAITDSLCTVIKTGESFHVCLSGGTNLPVFDGDVTVCSTVSLGETANILKTKMEKQHA